VFNYGSVQQHFDNAVTKGDPEGIEIIKQLFTAILHNYTIHTTWNFIQFSQQYLIIQCNQTTL